MENFYPKNAASRLQNIIEWNDDASTEGVNGTYDSAKSE